MTLPSSESIKELVYKGRYPKELDNDDYKKGSYNGMLIMKGLAEIEIAKLRKINEIAVSFISHIEFSELPELAKLLAKNCLNKIKELENETSK